jgi:hypothetical protein
MLPILSHGRIPGFRPVEKAYWKRDRSMLLRGQLEWVNSENWAADQVSTRGRLPANFCSLRTLLIGAGAIGSAVAEALARGGLRVIRIYDEDELVVGNLVRHVLTMEDLRKNKALALAARLNRVSPHVEAMGFASQFQKELARQASTDTDLILECTGKESVLGALESIQENESRVFVSISIGFEAKRLFVYMQKKRFIADRFLESLQPWLQKEFDERGSTSLPREGIGCWHPVFPARTDQVWMMAALAVKVIVERYDQAAEEGRLFVYEETQRDGKFVGVQEVTAA